MASTQDELDYWLNGLKEYRERTTRVSHKDEEDLKFVKAELALVQEELKAAKARLEVYETKELGRDPLGELISEVLFRYLTNFQEIPARLEIFLHK